VNDVVTYLRADEPTHNTHCYVMSGHRAPSLVQLRWRDCYVMSRHRAPSLVQLKWRDCYVMSGHRAPSLVQLKWRDCCHEWT